MNESDWKAFRKIVPDLRERYIQRRNVEISALLGGADLSETERFWNAHEKISEEAIILRRCLDGHRRSRMVDYVYEMLSVGMLTTDDLSVFSDELQERARSWYKENIIRTNI